MPKKVKQGKLVLTHGQLKKQVMDYLRWHKWLVIPINQGPFAYDGIADLYILRCGFHAWIEIKVGDDKQSKHQKKFESDITKNNVHYWIVYTLEGLESYLKIYTFLDTKPVRKKE